MGLFDTEEDDLTQPATPDLTTPDDTSAPVAAPMNPNVKDYLAQKYGLDKYSPEARKQLEAQNAEDRSGPNWAAALSAFGAGIQGKDGSAAGQAVINNQERTRQNKLADFDRNKAFAMQDIDYKNKLAKTETDSDPNSESSKAAQELAIKMGMSPDKAVNLTAAKFKELSPTLAQMYKIDEGIKIRDEDRNFKERQLAEQMKLRHAEFDARKAKEFTPGQKALDTSFAKEYNDWTSGGEAAVDKNLKRLEDAKNKLAASKDDLVGYSGGVVGRLPDWARSEASKTIQQDVQAAAQGALKATLGSQFTEKEGERIMNMAYDPTLSPKANIAKIESAIGELRTQKDNKNLKATHFDEKGTLAGFSPAKDSSTAGSGGPSNTTAQNKTVVKTLVSPSTGKTKLVYDDGTEEIVDGSTMMGKK